MKVGKITYDNFVDDRKGNGSGGEPPYEPPNLGDGESDKEICPTCDQLVSRGSHEPCPNPKPHMEEVVQE